MKILIVADVHMRRAVDVSRQNRSFEALRNAFSKVPCDLAVILGDLMHGPDYRDNREGYIADLRKALDATGDVPFAFAFGNHDAEGALTKSEILEVMGEYPNALTRGKTMCCV